MTFSQLYNSFKCILQWIECQIHGFWNRLYPYFNWIIPTLLFLVTAYLIAAITRLFVLGIVNRYFKERFSFLRKNFKAFIILPLRILYFLYYPLEVRLSFFLSKRKYRKNLFEIPFLHTLRLNNIRFLNVRDAVSHSPASTFSLILSYASIFIGIIVSSPASVDSDHPNLLSQILFLAIILFLPIPIYLRSYILNLPLEQYSSLIKSSLNESEMISFISYKIWRQCEIFEKRTLWLTENISAHIQEGPIDNIEIENIFSRRSKIKKKKYSLLIKKKERDETTANGIWCGKPENGKLLQKRASYIKREGSRINKLVREINNSEMELQRIFILQAACSERLRIPMVEICEHLFQFSPTMYKAWMKKFSSNLQVVTELANISGRNSYDRISSLLAECQRFIARNKNFMKYQCENIAFSDLHTDIIDFSSQNSSVESVRIYIRTLSKIASENPIAPKVRFDRRLIGVLKAINLYKIFRRYQKSKNKNYICKLAYIFYKRKTHIGLDLHFSANRFLDQICKSNDLNLNKKHSLRRLGLIFSKGVFTKTIASHDNSQVLTEFQQESVKYIENCRTLIAEKFQKKLRKFIEEIEPEEYLFIITFGSSKIVRDIIKFVLPQLLDNDKRRKVIKNKKGEIIDPQIKVIVFESEEEFRIDSRRIKYYLTEEEGKGFENVVVSNTGFILPLINSKSKIMILIGAESFDNEKRIIRTSCYKTIIKEFLKDSQARMGLDIKSFINNVQVIVCAESFKFNPDILKIEEYFDDQYERIEMLEPELISLIISDIEVKDNYNFMGSKKNNLYSINMCGNPV